MKAAIYCRVSTSKQNTDRQVSELQAYAYRHDMEVVTVIRETVSGSKKKVERPGLAHIFELARKGEISEVLSLELSRLGRNAMDVREIILELIELKVSTHIVNRNLRSLDSKRRKDSTTLMVLGILADLAEMEKEQLIERIHSGLEEAKRKGMRLGRKVGSRKSEGDFLKEHKQVAALLKGGQSLRNTQKIAGVSRNTVIKVKRLLAN
jgi:DNA invertase Pin-like site-specific DNA recombinase